MDKKLIPNSTQVPNVIMDFLLPLLPEAEGKCIRYICRRTYGFHKEEDRISFSQFVNGIVSKDGKILDYGAGISRPSVSEALKNLNQAGAIIVRKDSKGNYYKINLDMNTDKVVKKVNQLRKLTRIGKESKPKQVKLFNLQKKGNKGNKDILSPSQKMELFLEGKEFALKLAEMISEKTGISLDKVISELNNFKSYWTELNKNGTKQRWQLEKTFELKRRFDTWLRNSEKWNNDGTQRNNQDDKYWDSVKTKTQKRYGF